MAECRTAGIRVKMITGDHAGTARAIAAKLKLKNSAEAITGHGLDQMDDAALTERVRDVDVYARVSPEHKLRLVMLLQAQGAIVAMTGGRPTRGIGMKPRFELRWLSVVVLPPANIGPVAASPHGAQVSGAGS